MTSLRETLRRSLLLLSMLGLIAFGGALLTSFLAPLTIEQAAREVIRIEVQRWVGERIDALSDSRLAALARRALDQTTNDANRLERQLREQLPQRVAHTIADLLDADCECRKRLVEAARQTHERKLGSLQEAQAHLSSWIEQAYAHTRGQLLREVRIVAATNAVLFALLGLLCLWKRQSTRQLALAAVTLLGACAVVAGLYLFKQDWLHTLVFGDYIGWGYAVYLAAVAALFADITFNKAQVSAQLLNAVPIVPPC